MKRIEGTFRDVRFEIAHEGDRSHFARLGGPPGRLCRCSRNLLVSSILGKPLWTIPLEAVAFALGPGYEAFPDYVQRLLAEAGLLKGKRATSYPHSRHDNLAQLRECGATVVNEPFVIDDRIISCAGPAQAIDVALRSLQHKGDL